MKIVIEILLADCAMTHEINHELEERGGVLHVAITDLGCDRFMIYLFLAHLDNENVHKGLKRWH